MSSRALCYITSLKNLRSQIYLREKQIAAKRVFETRYKQQKDKRRYNLQRSYYKVKQGN